MRATDILSAILGVDVNELVRLYANPDELFGTQHSHIEDVEYEDLSETVKLIEPKIEDVDYEEV